MGGAIRYSVGETLAWRWSHIENYLNKGSKEARMCEERIGKRAYVMSRVFAYQSRGRQCSTQAEKVLIVSLKLLLEFYPVVGRRPLTVFDQRNEMIVCITSKSRKNSR